MRSIIALLLIVAVANANTVKEGGLKGSWYEMFELISTEDLVAPAATDIQWTSWDDQVSSTAGPYSTNITGGWSDTGYLDFQIDNEAGYWSPTCELMLVLGEITDEMPMGDNTIMCSSYIWSDGDGDGTCYTGYYVKPGTYVPWLTCWDQEGNWAQWTDPDVPSVMIYNNEVDFTMPVITVNMPTADLDIEIPADSNRDDFWEIEISIDVNDDGENDGWSSTPSGAWAQITGSNSGLDETDEETFFLDLYYDTYDINTEIYTYGTIIQVYNWAAEGSWTIDEFTAVDKAGNWATAVASGMTVTITTLADDDVPNCQTFDVGLTSYSDDQEDLDITSGYGTIYFNLGCTNKFEGDNYAAFSFMGPAVTKAGDTEESNDMMASYGSAVPPSEFAMLPVTLGTSISYASYVYPGTSFTDLLGDPYWSGYMYFYDGAAAGDWMLYEIYTSTETGSVQRYTGDLGSASSVVPSVLVVAVALVAAMLRL